MTACFAYRDRIRRKELYRICHGHSDAVPDLWRKCDVEEKVRGKIEELEDTLSVTKEGSPMWNLNEKKNENFAEEFANLMLQSLKLCKDTDGALDISAYPIVKAWGFTTGEHRIPDEEERKALVSRVDYRKIQVNGNTVSIEPDMMVDLGSVGKGYTAEVLANLMKEEGVTSALFSLGGNIQTVGTKSDGSDWSSVSGQQKRTVIWEVFL